ncbi:MAG: PrsW family intramembrane metalloprotease [Spirulina sp. SIO3F2]|nr:PrsW family intramembrane metalloprotease [Spirulina sp. SIO3F2]
MDVFIASAIVLTIPAYFYTWFIRSIDRFEKEPTAYLFGAFLWGAFPAVLAAIVLQVIFDLPVEAVLGANSLGSELITAAIGAPITEEILKGCAVAIVYFAFRREFDGWVDGIVYGGVAGFGFAYVENILYLTSLTEGWGDWFTLLMLRTVVFGGLHGFWTGLTGIGFGLARYSHNLVYKVVVITGGLLAAIVGHLIHNGSVTLVEASGGATLLIALLNYGMLAFFMIVLWFVAGYNDRRRLEVYLRAEVPQVLTPDCYQGLCKPRSQRLAKLGFNKQQRRKFVQLAAELAQKKLQLQKMGEEGGNSREIDMLRSQLQALIKEI